MMSLSYFYFLSFLLLDISKMFKRLNSGHGPDNVFLFWKENVFQTHLIKYKGAGKMFSLFQIFSGRNEQ